MNRTINYTSTHAVDFNECTIPGLCQQNCTNSIGGYYCFCQVGFNLIAGHNCTGKLIANMTENEGHV